MNISLTNKQALELVVFLEKENTFPLVSRQINNNFKEMEVSEWFKLQEQFPPTFTAEFEVKCVKCGKEFESIPVKTKTRRGILNFIAPPYLPSLKIIF